MVSGCHQYDLEFPHWTSVVSFRNRAVIEPLSGMESGEKRDIGDGYTCQSRFELARCARRSQVPDLLVFWALELSLVQSVYKKL